MGDKFEQFAKSSPVGQYRKNGKEAKSSPIGQYRKKGNEMKKGEFPVEQWNPVNGEHPAEEGAKPSLGKQADEQARPAGVRFDVHPGAGIKNAPLLNHLGIGLGPR